MRRVRLMELLLGTDTRRPPVFQLRHEYFRLARGLASILPGESSAFVVLELERTEAPSPFAAASLVTLRARDVAGEDSVPWVNGRRARVT